MTRVRAYLVFRRIVRLIGSPTGFVPVAIVALYAHGIGGHPLDALPFLFEWALVVGACSYVGKWLPSPRDPGLPANRAPPPAALAVSITPPAPGEASPDLDTMKARLPPVVSRLLT